MSLTFGTSGDRVDCGSGSTLDNLPSVTGAFTVWCWIYRTGTGDNQHIIAKDNSYPSGFALALTNVAVEGQIQLFLGRTTTATSFVSDSSNVADANTWVFIAASFDDAASPKVKLFRGTLTTPVAEVTGYSITDAGSGTLNSDAAANLYLGNIQRATSLPFKGRIAVAGVENAALTAGQLVGQQYRPRPRTTTVGLWVLGENGTSTQADKSGNGNNGTVTGATVSDHVPIPRLFGV